jgi:hypothetical protein
MPMSSRTIPAELGNYLAHRQAGMSVIQRMVPDDIAAAEWTSPAAPTMVPMPEEEDSRDRGLWPVEWAIIVGVWIIRVCVVRVCVVRVCVVRV